jgi:hypothetical protein
MFFRSSSVGRYQKTGHVNIPIRFAEQLNNLEDRKLIVVPLYNSLILIPEVNFDRNPMHWIQEVLWDSSIKEVVSHNTVYPSTPFFQNNISNEKLHQAANLLKHECITNSKIINRLSGHDFEKLIAEVFRTYGITVQMNIRLLGAEVDLLLIEFDDKFNKKFSIIECKHRSISKKSVGISEVLRIYGLSEALRRKDIPIERSIIVTTNEFSMPAKSFSKIYNLELVEFEALVDWIKQNKIEYNNTNYPVFQNLNFDNRARIYIPKLLRQYLKLSKGSEIAWVGTANSFELMKKEFWEHAQSETRKWIESGSARLELEKLCL